MNEVECTPGPWEKVCRLDHTGEPELFVQTADGREKRVVTWDTPYPDNADCANAELIAKAPELLAEVKSLRAEVHRHGHGAGTV